MFNNFDAFRIDFCAKLYKITSFNPEYYYELRFKQTRETQYRTYDEGWHDHWYDTDAEYEYDFDEIRYNIIEMVRSNYEVSSISWLSDIEYSSYSDYYDCGENQEFTIDLRMLYSLVK